MAEELERQLLSEFRQAIEDYKLAAAEYKILLEQAGDLGLLNPDGALSIERAATRQNFAFQKYRKALKAFADLVLDGKRPE